jgi:hypothetical protein
MNAAELASWAEKLRTVAVVPIEPIEPIEASGSIATGGENMGNVGNMGGACTRNRSVSSNTIPGMPEPPAIDPRKRRDVIAEQPNPPAYVAWLHAKD